ncbi:diguanylate cyclase domain-containing protein [Amycolatopsis pigmentata]|uniref:Diguanylate cyclase domain-containing protein n=1 Tax=Amycolatopsis pigmentata TaxID=450801 RepID=A0ABW5FND8_9PSEU
MTEPGEAPGVAEVVRRWVGRLAHTEGIGLSPDRLEELLTEVTGEALAATEAAREAAARRFNTLYSAAPIGVALADVNCEIVEVNAEMTRFLGRRAEELQGMALADLAYSDHDAETILSGLEDLTETEAEHVRQRVQLTHADDAAVWADITLTYLPSDRPNVAYPVMMAMDSNEVHALQETLRHQSVHDSLTGLSNASRFKTLLEGALSPSARGQVALIYFDLDGFRVINDGLGAGVGDKVLRGVAAKLRDAFTEHKALVARLSGDGFAVLLRGQLSAAEVIGMVEEAMVELAEPIYMKDQGVGVSASAGIVVRNVAEATAEDLQRGAELALHRAKEAGRGQWMLFDSELDRVDRARYRLGAEIAGALENGQFVMTYYPTVSLADPEEITAISAGLRWHHPEQGELDPAQFYPLAETTGMVAALGRWLIGETLAMSARLRERYGDDAPELCIRLPKRLVMEPELVKMIRENLDRNNVPANALRVCTRAAIAVDRDGEVRDSLPVLADLGVKLVLIVHNSADLELIPRHGLDVRYVMLGGPVVDAFALGEPEPAAVRHLEYLLGRATELDLRVGAEGVYSAEHAERLSKFGVLVGRGPFVPFTDEDGIDELIGGGDSAQ